MRRIKIEEVRTSLKVLNELLPDGTEILLAHRYDYLALDLKDKDCKHGSIRRTIASGLTKREVYEHIWAMVEGIRLQNA